MMEFGTFSERSRIAHLGGLARPPRLPRPGARGGGRARVPAPPPARPRLPPAAAGDLRLQRARDRPRRAGRLRPRRGEAQGVPAPRPMGRRGPVRARPRGSRPAAGGRLPLRVRRAAQPGRAHRRLGAARRVLRRGRRARVRGRPGRAVRRARRDRRRVRERPPDDEVRVLSAEEAPGGVEASYSWATEPDRRAGRLLLNLRGSLIERLVVIVEDPLDSPVGGDRTLRAS